MQGRPLPLSSTPGRMESLAAGMLLALGLLPLSPAAAGPADNCFPDCDIENGKFLAIAGANFQTLSDPEQEIRIVVPAGAASFDVGIFDGDSGEVDAIGAFHWDAGPTTDFEYTLFADPFGDASGTTIVEMQVGSPVLPSAAMPDNDWVDFTVATGPEALAPSGNYSYYLLVRMVDPLIASLNAFRVRSTGVITVEQFAQPFSYIANWSSLEDLEIVYPDFPAADPTNYDGSWSFFFELAEDTDEVAIWDGDFDYSSFDDMDLDTDDPDTPGAPFVPPWDNGKGTPEGVSPGDPRDDANSAGFGVYVVRPPSIVYDLIFPGGSMFTNVNPSGNQEWEQFRISTEPFDPTLMDFNAPSVPAGTYEMRIRGMDMLNLNAVFLPGLAKCVDIAGNPCSVLRSFLVGDTVFEDIDGSGVQDPGEPGIAGVVVELLGPSMGLAATTVTDGTGSYQFGVDRGTYTIRIAAENFDPGGALENMLPTVADQLTDTVTDDNVLTYDFGYRGGASIGDLVFRDEDGDGLFASPPDSALAGVTVNLIEAGPDGLLGTADDMALAPAMTDASGAYLFVPLPAGLYRVDVDESTLPPGLLLTTANEPLDVALAASEAFLDADFGYAPAGAIGDLVFRDEDGDGLFASPPDSGLAGVAVNLTEAGPDGLLGTADDIPLPPAVTDPGGGYLFPSLAAGLYRVDVDESTLPAGLGLTTANEPLDVALGPGQSFLDADFGYAPLPGSIGDLVFRDEDGDGLFASPPDSGLEGVAVGLTEAGPDGLLGTADDVPLPAAVTDAAGAYLFADLTAGLYRVDVDESTLPAGLALSTANEPLDVPLAAGESFLDADFGYAPLPGSIGDLVFRDEDGDGLFASPPDSGLEGVAVGLTEAGPDGLLGTADDVPLPAAVTDAAGAYLFADLTAGLYRVDVDESTLPAGLALTTANEPLDIALADGEDFLAADFGYQPRGSIGDYVWLDEDGDAMQNEPMENGIPGVVVHLTEAGPDGLLDTADDVVLPPETTSVGGFYLFTDLPPGLYRVDVDESTLPATRLQPAGPPPPALLLTTDNEPMEVALGLGEDFLEADFGYRGEEPMPVLAIPTLSEWGGMCLAALLAMLALFNLRRQRLQT